MKDGSFAIRASLPQLDLRLDIVAFSRLLGASANVSASCPFMAFASPSRPSAAPLPGYVDGIGILTAVGIQVTGTSWSASAGLGCTALPRAITACEVGGEGSREMGRASFLATFTA